MSQIWQFSRFSNSCVIHRPQNKSVLLLLDRPMQYSMQATNNWKELIDDTSIDAIVIGTWPYLHKTITIAALDAGKHVLTEARLVYLKQNMLTLLANLLVLAHKTTADFICILWWINDQATRLLLSSCHASNPWIRSNSMACRLWMRGRPRRC